MCTIHIINLYTYLFNVPCILKGPFWPQEQSRFHQLSSPIVLFVLLSCFVPWDTGLFFFYPGMPHLHLVWGWPQEQISSYRPSLTIVHFVPINFLSSDTQCQWHLVNWEGPWPVQLSPQDFTQLVPGGQDVPGPSIAGICHFVFCICYFVFVTATTDRHTRTPAFKSTTLYLYL